MHVCIYSRGSAEKFVGRPRYSHGLRPNEVYFLTSYASYLTDLFHLCLDPIG